MAPTPSVNVALDLCALVMLALTFWRLVAEHRAQMGRERLLAAALLHGGALVCQVASNVPALLGHARPTLPLCLALAVDACSVCAFLAYMLTDADGHVRLSGRTTPPSPALVGWALGPCAVTGALLPLAGGVNALGVAYAVSLSMACLLLARTYEIELARREQEVASAQSKLFAELMRPHFLFNTLTSISSLCYTDPDAAAEAIADLSGYLRGNIDALSSDEPIPFETELAHISQYVALEQADPARVFTMEYDLAAKPFSIPPLTVQPLVENAIKHGALTRKDGQGRVRLATEDRGRYVRVVVEDNGVGNATNTAADKQGTAHEGMGLRGVERRLAVHGGSLTVEFGEGGGRALALVPRGEGQTCAR